MPCRTFHSEKQKRIQTWETIKCGTNFQQNKLKSSTDFVDSDQLPQFTNLPNQYTNKRREKQETQTTLVRKTKTRHRVRS